MNDQYSSFESSNNDHTKFIELLETHGISNHPNVWNRIATDMGWTVEETKLYGYRYMHQLQEELQSCRAKNSGITLEWCLEDNILFENLLLAYSHSVLQMNDDSKWLEISSKIPSKTIEQCKERYRELYQGK
jgi:hypothetical protein